MNDEELIKETMRLDYSQLVMHNVYMIKENKRLNNIINEFERWLEEMKKYYGVGYYDTSINKLQELKGGDKE